MFILCIHNNYYCQSAAFWTVGASVEWGTDHNTRGCSLDVGAWALGSLIVYSFGVRKQIGNECTATPCVVFPLAFYRGTAITDWAGMSCNNYLSNTNTSLLCNLDLSGKDPYQVVTFATVPDSILLRGWLCCIWKLLHDAPRRRGKP